MDVAIGLAVGVQVAGIRCFGVGVMVGVLIGVGGGYGLIDLYGSIRSAAIPTHIHKVINNTITVSIFQIIAAVSLVGWRESSE